MKARLDTYRVFGFLDKNGDLGGSATVSVLLPDGQAVPLSAAPTVQFADLYLSSAFLPKSVGMHSVSFEEPNAGTVLSHEYMNVGSSPTPDGPLGEAFEVVFGLDTAVLDNLNVTVTVLKDLGTVIEENQAVPFSAAKNGYPHSITLDSEGDYFFVFMVDGVPAHVEHRLILTRTDLEPVRMIVGTLAGNNGTPHAMAKVVISDPSGAHVAQSLTDAQGDARLELPPGSYICSLVKDGVVYTTNNQEFTVFNSRTTEPDDALARTAFQAYQIQTDSLSPTLSDNSPAVDRCTLFANLYTMEGHPMAHVNVQVTLRDKAKLLSGGLVAGGQKVYRTDHNGHVEFDLVQGIEVDVTLSPLGFRRVITVPSGGDAASPVDLYALMLDSDDLLDIQRIEIPAAPRRTQ